MNQLDNHTVFWHVGWCLASKSKHIAFLFLFFIKQVFEVIAGWDLSNKRDMTSVIWSTGDVFRERSSKKRLMYLIVASNPSSDSAPRAYSSFAVITSGEWCNTPCKVWFTRNTQTWKDENYVNNIKRSKIHINNKFYKIFEHIYRFHGISQIKHLTP